MKKLLLIFIVLGTTFTAGAQCRTFVKNHCGDAMGEYVPSENFNAAKLLSGDHAQLDLTFFDDQDYRLLVCSHDILGDVKFVLTDDEGQVIHDNSKHGFESTFDFRLAGTQELTLNIDVPESESKIRPQGCVAIIVGRKVAVN